jgi:hypothetical protein
MPHPRAVRPASRRTPSARARLRFRLRLRMPLVVAAALGIALTGSSAPALALGLDPGRPAAVRAAVVEERQAPVRPSEPLAAAGPDAAELPAHLTVTLALLAAGITAVGMVRRPERP